MFHSIFPDVLSRKFVSNCIKLQRSLIWKVCSFCVLLSGLHPSVSGYYMITKVRRRDTLLFCYLRQYIKQPNLILVNYQLRTFVFFAFFVLESLLRLMLIKWLQAIAKTDEPPKTTTQGAKISTIFYIPIVFINNRNIGEWNYVNTLLVIYTYWTLAVCSMSIKNDHIINVN